MYLIEAIKSSARSVIINSDGDHIGLHQLLEFHVRLCQDHVSQRQEAAQVTLFGVLAFEKAHRVLVVMVAVALMWAISYLTPYRLLTLEATAQTLDMNVLLLLASMMAQICPR